MNRSTVNTTAATNLNVHMEPAVSSSKPAVNLRNLAAFHEMMIREQFLVPEFHSKFVNKETLFQMYTGEIFSIKTPQLIYRNGARPPQKLVLAQKMEAYLSAKGLKSGINFAKANFPDKQYLLQMVAHLSKGKDEIFDPEYIPSKSIAKEVEKQLGKGKA